MQNAKIPDNQYVEAFITKVYPPGIYRFKLNYDFLRENGAKSEPHFTPIDPKRKKKKILQPLPFLKRALQDENLIIDNANTNPKKHDYK